MVPAIVPYTFWLHTAVGPSNRTKTANNKIERILKQLGISFLPWKIAYNYDA
jgi:hypothetical protein